MQFVWLYVYRRIQRFVWVTFEIQKSDPAFQSLKLAKLEAQRLLGGEIPSESEFEMVLAAAGTRRGRGRPPVERTSKRDAVAAVAVYFESVGAGAEQAIIEAKKWLNLKLSRRVAKVAVSAFKANTSPTQFRPQAQWAYMTFKPGTTQKLPESIIYVRKKRQAKPDLG